ncbi:tyrosine-type recombinase/integrase [Halolamina salifodinae]|uniref:Integrase n=1 Tax=Halolamina salifodinae TaxID=1202767 RepID=A0A8T4GX24_9EURY|nr:site-specific integrase [Halolamina salifodinae]MBP1986194.1 integrase [Halolamina salifodinae]
MNKADPLENLGNDDSLNTEIPPAPDNYEFGYPLVSKRSEEDLKKFGLNMVEDYRDFKRELLSWLATYGKNPEKHEGLAETTLESTHYKLETVFRWLWRYESQYTTRFTPEHANKFIRVLDQSDGMIDSTVLHHAKDIQRYFRFSNYVRGTEYEWEVDIELSQSNGDERDYLRRSAFEPLYQAALDHSSVKGYHSVSPEERSELKTFVAQRLGIPKEKVGPDEFKQANSWKYPSMISVTLDTGLRPIEVGRAKVSWVNLEDNELNIPKEESTKNEAHWNCAIKKRTAKTLRRWLDERASLEKYDGREELWLTQKSSQYGSKSCNALLHRVIDNGDVPIPEHRDISWYSIRHGVATYWANHVGPHHAKEQLRHKSLNTTMKYLHSDAETRNSAVEQIW